MKVLFFPITNPASNAPVAIMSTVVLLLVPSNSCRKIGPNVGVPAQPAALVRCCRAAGDLFTQGFARVNSTTNVTLQECPLIDPNKPTVCVFERYDNKEPGDVMKVCIDSPIPDGWAARGPFFDHYGCDAPKYEGSGLPNERLILKQ